MFSRGRRMLGGLFLGMVGALAAASVAFACTDVTGQTIISTSEITTCPSSSTTSAVQPGQDIWACANSVSGAYGSRWHLYFLNFDKLQHPSMDACMAGVVGPEVSTYTERHIGGPATQTSTTIAPIKGQVPLDALSTNADTGPALICFMTHTTATGSVSYLDYNASTTPAEVAVIGRP